MTEVYYQVQYSHKDADDWYSSGREHDDLEVIVKALADEQNRHKSQDFDFRIVRKTVIEEVVPL